MSAVIAFAQALIAGVPKVIALIKAGRDPGGIKLSEVVSTDALAKLKGAQEDASDFIANG